MSNKVLADAYITAVSDDRLDANNPNYPNDPGVKRKSMCSRFNRCANRLVYGQKYQSLYAGSARESALNFQAAGLAMTKAQAGPLQLGDILWEVDGSGGYGHVMGVCDARRVAENSIVHDGEKPNGCKGFRLIEDVIGRVDLITRLPAPNVEPPHYTLVVGGRTIVMPISNGTAFCPVREWCSALGLDVEWDERVRRAIIEGRDILGDDGKPLPANIVGGKDMQPVRALARLSGLKVDVNNETRVVKLER